MSWRGDNRIHPEERITRTVDLREDGDVHGWRSDSDQFGELPVDRDQPDRDSWAERNGHDE